MIRHLRKRAVSASSRRVAQTWCTLGAVAILAIVAVVRLEQTADEESVSFAGAWSRRLQFFDEQIIGRWNCTESFPNDYTEQPIMFGEAFPRPLYYCAPTGKKFGVILHIIIIGYMLLGLNTVCDAYFTGALEVMVEKWNIKPDVAGATFMAAGGSAPELFTSLIGACIVTNDVGFGTIVGSAVFNVLFVIGLCGYFAKTPISLTWWPLFRDCSYYIFGLLVLALLARSPKVDGMPGYIEHWEACLLFALYILYCVIMYFSEGLESFLKAKIDSMRGKSSSQVAPEPDQTTEETQEKPATDNMLRKGAEAGEPASEVAAETPDVAKGEEKKPDEDEPPETKIEKPENEEEKEEKQEEDEEEEEDAIEEMMVKPEGAMNQIIWYVSLPIYGLLYYLIPKPDHRLFIGTFLISLCWIAFFSFWLVFSVEILGEICFIPVIVMGFTLLAAGTSIPDLVSSVAVARAGEGDMAVSSSIGSNIFDILVGLPIPWMLKILVVDPASGKGTPPIPIGGFIVFYVLVLLFMVFMVIVSIHCLGWKLNKMLGVFMGVLYVLFLALALSVEFASTSVNMDYLKF